MQPVMMIRSALAAVGLLALAACGQDSQPAPIEAVPADTPAPQAQPLPEQVDARVAGTAFHATGTVACALAAEQPMGQCDAGVIRNTDGSAVVKVSLPDGRTRSLFFDRTGAVGSDVSQADGAAAQGFRVEKVGDLYKIFLGSTERYEAPEALVVGG